MTFAERQEMIQDSSALLATQENFPHCTPQLLNLHLQRAPLEFNRRSTAFK
jgi:hypothetical protein